MKQIIIMLCFIGAASFVQAANLNKKNNVKSQVSGKSIEKSIKSESNSSIVKKEDFDDLLVCTAGATGTISIAGSSITISCSATADTCESAVSQASGCVKAFKAALLAILK